MSNFTVGFGIRLNKKPPSIYFKKKDKGGINFTSTAALTHLDADAVKAILSEYRIHNADVSFKADYTADDLIDVIEGYVLKISIKILIFFLLVTETVYTYRVCTC